MPGRVDGKVALVTGGARGQGAAHGEMLARQGARVIIADVLDDEGSALQDRLRAEGLTLTYRHLDVSSQPDWHDAISFVEEHFGTITILVNNAGITAKSGIAECSLDLWHRAIAVNQTRGVLRHAGRDPGDAPARCRIHHQHGVRLAHTGGAPNRAAAYIASKAAVLGLTRNAALSLAADGIRVNSISPAVVATPQVGDPDAVPRELIERTPMKRAAQPVEISYLVLYLASDEASYVTGQDHLIDGGLHTV